MRKLYARTSGASPELRTLIGCHPLKATLFAVLAFLLLTFSSRPVANQARGAASLAVPRLGHTATVLADGRVVIIGGHNHDGLVSMSEIFDPASGAFLLTANLGEARTDHTAIGLADGRVFVIGGRANDRRLQSTVRFWRFERILACAGKYRYYATYGVAPSAPNPTLSAITN